MVHAQPLLNERYIEPDMGKAFNKIAAVLNDAICFAEREKRRERVAASAGRRADRSTTRHSLRDNPRTSQ